MMIAGLIQSNTGELLKYKKNTSKSISSAQLMVQHAPPLLPFSGTGFRSSPRIDAWREV
jgi:hypothetical protein